MINPINIKVHDFILGPVDTDSISFRKPDHSPFTEEEMQSLLTEINSLMPPMVEFEDDGYFEKVIVLKAKNYILDLGENFDPNNHEKKITLKGSSLKDSKKSLALKEMLDTFIQDLLDTEGKNIETIYHKYIIEATNIQDISRWATKKSITKAVLNPTRTNEQKVLDALRGKDFSEGDKVYLYSAIDGEKQDVKKGVPQVSAKGKPKMVANRILRCVEDWGNDYDRKHYIKRVYMTLEILKNVVDLSEITKYHLKGNKDKLEKLINES